MRFLFTGTGTSQGVPVIACQCRVCKSGNVRDQRLRSAGVIFDGGMTIAIDAGPDFRQQMLRADIRSLDAILFTHHHKDHIAGLDDVRAFNFLLNKDMPIYANAFTLERLRIEFDYAFTGYPGVPQLAVHTLTDAPFMLGHVAITPVPVLHGDLPIYGFRLQDFAYITDARYLPALAKERLQNLDTLVINALRLAEHHSHLTLAQALEVVEELKPRQTYFTHISHLLGAHEEVEAMLPPHVKLAYDGLELEW